MTLLEILYVYSNLCIKLKRFSTYLLLNASLKELVHFILIRIMTLLEIVRIHEYRNTRIQEYTNTRIQEYTNT